MKNIQQLIDYKLVRRSGDLFRINEKGELIAHAFRIK